MWELLMRESELSEVDSYGEEGRDVGGCEQVVARGVEER